MSRCLRSNNCRCFQDKRTSEIELNRVTSLTVESEECQLDWSADHYLQRTITAAIRHLFPVLQHHNY